MKKFLFDLFPVILFFAVFELTGLVPASAQSLVVFIGYAAEPKILPILFGTAAAIFAVVFQISWVKLKHGKIDTLLWVSFTIIVVFGGATLILRDPVFFKWKPTILYWFLSGSLLISQIVFGKNIMREMMKEKLTLPDLVWNRLNLAWSLFFVFIGIINLYVAFYLYPNNDKAWAIFKVFGSTGIMVIFIILQAMMLAKYIDVDNKEQH